MKLAYYEVVRTEEEKKLRVQQVRSEHREDEDFYSVYIDVLTEYGVSPSGRKAFSSLMRAVAKGKVDTVHMHSVENMYMHEAGVYNMIMKMKRKGVALTIGEGSKMVSTAMDDGVIFDKMYQMILDFLLEKVAIEAMTMGDCFVHGDNMPFIYLEKDADAARGKYCYLSERDCRMEFIKGIIEYQNEGCLFYRSDVNSWYHVDSGGMEYLKEAFKACYETCPVPDADMLLEAFGMDEDSGQEWEGV